MTFKLLRHGYFASHAVEPMHQRFHITVEDPYRRRTGIFRSRTVRSRSNKVAKTSSGRAGRHLSVD